MVSSSSVPWSARPSRPFPAKRWLEQQYPFRVSLAVFAPPRSLAVPPASGRRKFPAQLWLADPRAWLADLQRRQQLSE